MEEALRAVRAALGPDAFILETRTLAENGSVGVEVTAMGEDPPKPRAVSPPGPAQGFLSQAAEEKLVEGLGELRSLLCCLIPSLQVRGALPELLAQGVPPDLLARLAKEAEKGEEVGERERVEQALIHLLPPAVEVPGEHEGKVALAFMGPAGVGKTTTLVKLSVRLARQGRTRIGWVSLDDRSLMGPEPLALYGGILGIPCEVVEKGENFAQALERLSACDLLLIDTAGLGFQEEDRLKELDGLLRRAPNLRRLLLLEASTNARDMERWMEFYGRVGFEFLLFTKVDLCQHFGPLLATLLRCGRPLSYLASGPKVTGALEVAKPERIVRLLFPGRHESCKEVVSGKTLEKGNAVSHEQSKT